MRQAADFRKFTVRVSNHPGLRHGCLLRCEEFGLFRPIKTFVSQLAKVAGHVADLVVVRAVRIGVTALGKGLLAHPAHEVQHILLLYFLHCRLLAMLDERIDAAAVAADTFSVHTTVLQILEIRFDRLRQWYSRSCGSSLLHGAFLPRHLGATAKRLGCPKLGKPIWTRKPVVIFTCDAACLVSSLLSRKVHTGSGLDEVT